jgi:hydrogenase nickel incorporation protein HypA/HybF
VHEVAVAQQMLDAVLAAAGAHGASRVRVVRLDLGALTCVDPECLSFAFEAGSRGTAAEGARLDIRTVPLRVRCRGCGADGERGGATDPCPACGVAGGEVTGGREIRLTTLDVDGPGEAEGAT